MIKDYIKQSQHIDEPNSQRSSKIPEYQRAHESLILVTGFKRSDFFPPQLTASHTCSKEVSCNPLYALAWQDKAFRNGAFSATHQKRNESLRGIVTLCPNSHPIGRHGKWDHPDHAMFAALTAHEEIQTLYSDTEAIGTRQAWIQAHENWECQETAIISEWQAKLKGLRSLEVPDG